MHQELRSLLAVTTESTSSHEYAEGRAHWLQRVVGFDALYLGAALPSVRLEYETSGVDLASVQACEAQSNRYWPDRAELNAAVVARGGVAIDEEVFSARRRDELPLYREVMSSVGVRLFAALILSIRRRPYAALYLGRTLRRPFEVDRELLAEALPLLSLGSELHARRPSAPARGLLTNEFSRREREIIQYLRLGLTNSQIACALGTSPNTVKNQIASLLRKADVGNRTELVAALQVASDPDPCAPASQR